MKVLYFDCFSGISGDMILGSLIDLIGDETVLLNGLKALNLDEFKLDITKKSKSGIFGTDVLVNLLCEHHSHRNLADIENIINSSSLSEKVKTYSKNVFTRLARAEAKVHNTTVDKIHFHEVGATDAIVDIVGACILLDFLAPDKIISSPLNDGRGFTKCAHGIIPVPVPAVMELISERGAKLNIIDSDKELVTPTGAAVICEFASEFSNLSMNGEIKVGYGLGKRDNEKPNLLRTVLINSDRANKKIVAETNLDDISGEVLSYVSERLFSEGALDVWFESIYMKKGRPAYKLSFICEEKDIEKLKEIIFLETTALGIREYTVKRDELERKIETADTKYGKIDIKHATYKDREKKSIEYDSAKKAAKENKVPISDIYKLI